MAKHVNKPIEWWRNILWLDESPFTLRYNAKKRVWRMAHERHDPRCLIGSVKHDKKINVWGSFAHHGVGSLVRIYGFMDTQMYINILGDNMLVDADVLFGRQHFPDENDVYPEEIWVYQQDNDPKHTANATEIWFTNNRVRLLDWPSQSPDLNPIENLWVYLNRMAANRRCQNENELFQVLSAAWREIPIHILNNLVDSMPSRCLKVIESRGYPTKY